MSHFIHVFIVVAALIWQLDIVQSNCDVCQANDAACVNQTSYKLCFGKNIPNNDQIFTCPDGLVCTDKAQICFQRSEVPASCGDNDSCGLCNESKTFACTSRNTFSFCFGATKPTTVNGTCPAGRFCDASDVNICVSTATANSIICHLDKVPESTG
ncbi:uncharacterized protein LOC6562277 [Drosophila grimshawi]|uniref:GH10924 n=1 Tax=Drosophila grimshawi TaxID=7222 RepID=B4JAY7_DROGR|nr:uncharacterized protein LOC6562277 [Drosophila grimshawi]EDW02857.1 GH10924 [Drosophila grimshawi]